MGGGGWPFGTTCLLPVFHLIIFDMYYMLLPAIGRLANPDYTQFLQVLRTARKHYSAENKVCLGVETFQWVQWPN